MNEYIQYEHHGKKVWVRADLQGKHRQICLCWKCALFLPGDRKWNCPIANEIYFKCVEHNLVTPVLECPKFQKRKLMI